MNEVRNYYNSHVQEEDQRLAYHAFELPITLHYIKRYLPVGSKILDLACGTGHYAEKLLDIGYQVGLSDISDENVNLTRKRVGHHKNLCYLERGNATDSELITKESWDAILLLGPLYHMPDRKDRLKLLQKMSKALPKNGYLFSGYMNRAQAMVYGLKKNPEGILEDDGAYELWKYGSDNSFVEGTEYFEHAYFSKPGDIEPLIREAGMFPLHLIGCEGVFGERFELYHNMDNKVKKAWFEFILENCEDDSMVHCSKHILQIAKK